MEYRNTKKATFQKRENRFVATCLIDGKEEKVHVKNTGRLEELFVRGAEAIVSETSNPNRKTRYDLVMIKKGERFFNVDSMMPNHLFREAFESGIICLDGYDKDCFIKAESTFGSSRFDFYIKGESTEAYVEVKGVNLEIDGRALFPDGVSERALKHVNELREAKMLGYDAFIVFVIQFEGAEGFSINEGHDYLRDALRAAETEGINIIAYSTLIEGSSVRIDAPVEITL